ncbi:MAG: IS200/IS605 family transposase [Candidatus Cloacimonadota bacterium]|nr:IS200/IS605 family transposase [Candidatus Cloacimonadota bacterium]
MSHTYYKIWLHIVWSTKDRYPLISNVIQKKLYEHIHEISSEKDYHLSLINGIEDHVHCLFSLNPKYAISKIVNNIKGESSHWVNEQQFIKTRFAWQRGFAAFSVSESNVGIIKKYIRNQKEHHKKQSFTEEWNLLLQKHNVVIEK